MFTLSSSSSLSAPGSKMAVDSGPTLPGILNFPCSLNKAFCCGVVIKFKVELPNLMTKIHCCGHVFYTWKFSL